MTGCRSKRSAAQPAGGAARAEQRAGFEGGTPSAADHPVLDEEQEEPSDREGAEQEHESGRHQEQERPVPGEVDDQHLPQWPMGGRRPTAGLLDEQQGDGQSGQQHHPGRSEREP